MPSEPTTLRAPRPADAEIVADLINACEFDLHGEPSVSVDDVRRTWTAPGIDPGRDAVVALVAGRIVGYAEFERVDTPHQIFFDGYVHPDDRGRGIGSALVAWAEHRATEIAEEAPPGEAVVLRHGLWTEETEGVTLFSAHGYRPVRSFFFMNIELDQSLPPPAWPPGISLRTFVPGQDDRALWAADEEAFADHWGFVPEPFEVYSHFNLEGEHFDPTLVFLATEGTQIVGNALCQAVRVEDPRKGWIQDLAVRRPWRRRGIALALLLHAFGEYARRGYERVGLAVDAESPTGALELYLKAGMSVQREAVCVEKALRPATR